jgi:hypothetical protein
MIAKPVRPRRHASILISGACSSLRRGRCDLCRLIVAELAQPSSEARSRRKRIAALRDLDGDEVDEQLALIVGQVDRHSNASRARAQQRLDAGD